MILKNLKKAIEKTGPKLEEEEVPVNVKKPNVRTRSGFLTLGCPHYSTFGSGVHIVASTSYRCCQTHFRKLGCLPCIDTVVNLIY